MGFDNILDSTRRGFTSASMDSDSHSSQWLRSLLKNGAEIDASILKAVGATDIAKDLSDKAKMLGKASDRYDSGENGSVARNVNRFAADVIASPENLLPIGLGGKAVKLADAVKSGAKTMAVVSPAMTVAHEYGDDTKTGSDIAKDAAISTVFGAGLGGAFGAAGYGASKLFSKIKGKADPKPAEEFARGKTDSKPAESTHSEELADGAEISLSDIKPAAAPKPTEKIDIDVLTKESASAKPSAEDEFVSKITDSRAKALDKTPEELAVSHPLTVEKQTDVKGSDYIKENPTSEKLLSADDNKQYGPDFVITEQPKDVVDKNKHPAYFEVEQWVKDTAGISDKDVVTNLSGLLHKHPEIFSTEADVFRLIKDVKDNPTHFLRGTNSDNAILAKIEDNGVIKKIGIQKDGVDNNAVVHAMQSTRKNEIDRTIRRQMEGSPTPSLPTSETAAHGTNVHSSAIDAKEILTNQSEDVNIVVKGMFEKLGDKYFIRLFSGSDITTIVHETAHYLEQTFSSAERAVYDKVFSVYEAGTKRSEAFAEGFVRWVADEKSVLPELQSIFAKFKDFILAAFRAVPDSAEANFKLTDEMKLFYRAMLGDVESKNTLGIAIEKETAKSESNVRLLQSAQPSSRAVDEPLFIRPTADMKGLWTRWVDGVYESAVALLNHPRLNDIKFLRQIREQALLSADRSELHIDSISEFRMRLTSGYDKAAELGKDISKNLNPKERETLTRLLENEKDEALRLLSDEGVDANKVSAMYKTVRAAIDENADTLVRFGALDEEDRISHYIKRIYQAQLEEAKAVYGGVFGGNTTARRGVEKTYTITDPLGDNHFFGEYIKLKGHTYKVESVERLADNKARLKLWRDYTLLERKENKQVSDGAFVVAYTMQKQTEQIEKARLLKKLSDSETRNFADPKAAEKAGYVKLDDNKLAFGALANKYVPNTLAQDLNFYLHTSQSVGALADTVRLFEEFTKASGWATAVGKVKVWKTVANPATHFGNVVSNIMLTLIDTPQAFKYMFSKKNFAEAEKAGLFSGTGGLGDIETLAKTLSIAENDEAAAIAKKMSSGITSMVKNAFIEPNTLLGDGLRNLYALEDNYFKAGYYGYYKAKYMAKGFDEDIAAKYAIAETIDRTIDFTKPLPPLVRSLDNAGIAPFVAFAYRSATTITKAVLRNPLSYAAFAAAGWGLAADPQTDAATPAHVKGSHNMFFLPDYIDLSKLFGSDGSTHTLINIGRFIPGFRYNPVDFVLRQLNNDPSDNGGQAVENLGFVGSFLNILQGKDGRTGMSFLHEDKKSGTTYESTPERFGKTVWMMWREFAPSYLGKTPQQFMDAIGGEKTDRLTGELVTPGSVVLSALIGKSVAVDVDRAARESAEKLRDTVKHRIDGYLDGTLSQKQMSGWIDSDIKKVTVLNNMEEKSLSPAYIKSLARGIIESEINSYMKKATSGKMSADEILAEKTKIKRRISAYESLE